MNSSTHVKYSSFVGIFIVFSIFAHSQTIINGGIVSGNWTESGSPYHIMGDIEVPLGSTLIIEAGVNVKIYSELSIKVYGKLLAEGTVNDSVFFIPIAEYWKGIQILNSPDTINLIYCSFKNFKNRINNGYAIKGGVIYGLNSHILISNSILSNNQAVSSANINWAMGGAICLENCQGFLLNSNLLNNSIQNSSSYTQGGFLGRGGALFLAGCNYIVQGNQIVQNSIELVSDMDGTSISEAKGGGIYIEGNNVWINNNIIQGNSCISYASGSGISWLEPGSGDAFSLGGGIFGGNMKNNIITNNYCQSEGIGGGGSGVGGYGMAESKGGGIYNAIVIDNNLIKNNHCHATADGSDNANAESSGGGVKGGFLNNNTIYSNNIQAYVGTIGSIDLSGAGVNSCVIENSIIYNNSGSDQISNSIVIYSCVQGGYAGLGNISSNPLFVSGPQGNFYLSQISAGQSQQSPCVDGGNQTPEIPTGTTRTDEFPDIGILDMGFHYLLEIIDPILIAGIDSDKSIGQIPCTVQFYDNSYTFLLDITQWSWDFQNDGVIDSNLENPIFTYNETGNYSVKLIVMGEDSINTFVDTIVVENYIQVCDILCGFTQDSTFGEYPLSVEFIDTSQIVNNAISTWKWDFQNDGIIDSYEQFPAWTYSWPGTYSVKLIIIDTSGYIFDTAINENLIDVFGIVAGFIAEPTQGIFPLTITFTDTSYSYLANQTQWKWDFQNDDVIDSWDQNPIWIYEELGIYSVKLTATDTVLGVSDSILKDNLVIVCDLSPEFYAEPLFGYNPLEVQFYDTSQFINTEIGIWEWDFENDGIFDSWDQNPIWLYDEPGSYSVEFRIIDSSNQILESCLKEDYIQILTTGINYNNKVEFRDSVTIFPNPFASHLNIEYYSEIKDEITINLFDQYFKLYANILSDVITNKGYNSYLWKSQENLRNGIYFLLINTKSGNQKLVKCIKSK